MHTNGTSHYITRQVARVSCLGALYNLPARTAAATARTLNPITKLRCVRSSHTAVPVNLLYVVITKTAHCKQKYVRGRVNPCLTDDSPFPPLCPPQRHRSSRLADHPQFYALSRASEAMTRLQHTYKCHMDVRMRRGAPGHSFGCWQTVGLAWEESRRALTLTIQPMFCSCPASELTRP
jgi:hypothetical protein